MAIQATNYDQTQEYDVAEMSDLYNDNLFINSDFRSGIINQKGKTSYIGESSKISYTIDMWYISESTQSKLGVNKGYVTVTIPNNGSYGCFIREESILTTDILTLALKLKDQAVKIYSNVNKTGKIGDVQSGVSVNLKNFNNGNGWNFYIVNTSGAPITLNVEFMKLEKGEHFTGMPVWNETLELQKCKFYYKDEVVTVNTIYDYENSQYAFYIAYEKMNKIPSVTVVNIQTYDIGGQWVNQKSIDLVEPGERSVKLKASFNRNLKNPSNQLVVNYIADSYNY